MPSLSKFKEKLKSIKLEPAMAVLFVYLMLIFSRAIIATMSESTNEYLVVIILQLLTFGIPAAIWYRLRALPRFRDDSLNYKAKLQTPPRATHIVIIAAACFMLISGCLLLSIGFTGRSSLEGSFSLYDTFISKYNGTPIGAVWLILAYAALPAVCEELVFRGILCTEYDKYGVVCSIAMNSLWFGFLHFNFSKLLVYIFAGAVLTVLLYATRSVYSVMIAHFAYNLFGIFGQQYVTEFYITAGSIGVVVVILITLLLLSSAVFCGAAYRLYSGYAKRDEPSDYSEAPRGKALLNNFRACLFTPTVIACAVVYLTVTIVMMII